MRTATAAVAILFAAVSPHPTWSADSTSDRAHVKTEPADSRATAEKEISHYVSRLAEAVAAESVLRIVPLVDAEQMSEMVVSSIRNKRLAAAMRETFGKRLIGQLASGFARSVSGWDRHQTSKMTIAESLDLATVTLRVWDQESYSNRIQCWLIRRKSGWKLYDFNELALGLRMTQLLLVTLDQVQTEGLAFSANDGRTLQLAVFSMHGGDYEAADKHLRIVENRKLPTLLEAIKWTVISLVATGLDDNERVLMALDRCEKLGQPFPIADYLRAVAHNQLGNHDEALAAADRFLKTFGEDSEALYERGLALEWLDRNDEALAAYRRGLDDSPGSAENLIGLGLLLPDDQKKEIATRFAASPHPAARFDDIAYEFADAEDFSALAELTKIMRMIAPEHINGMFYEAQLATHNEDHSRAAAIYGNILKRNTDEAQRPIWRTRFLEASSEARQLVAAYRAVPEKKEAFVFLSKSAVYGNDCRGELMALIDEYRKEFPNDPLSWYFTGESHYHSDEFQKADEAYARASSLMPTDLYPHWIQMHRVTCWYRLGKEIEAYETFEPSDVTIRELTKLFIADERFDEALKLLDAHDKAAGKSALTMLWKSRIFWKMNRFEQLVNVIGPNLEKPSFEVTAWDVREMSLLLMKSMLRLGRYNAAARTARTIELYDESPTEKLLIMASRGQVEESLAYVEYCMNELDAWAGDILEDEDLNCLLQSESAALLRTRLVQHFFEQHGYGDSLALLLHESVKVSVDDVINAARKHWDVELVQIPGDKKYSTDADHWIIQIYDGYFEVRTGELELTINSSDEPTCQYPHTVAAEIPDSDIRELYQQHRAVLEVSLRSNPINNEEWRKAASLLVELAANAKPALVEASSRQHLAEWKDSLKRKMLGDDPLGAITSTGTVSVIRNRDDNPTTQ